MKSRWRLQEARLHKQGLRRVPGSGSGYRKGDARGQTFLVQAKTTDKSFFTLKEDDVLKMQREARLEERIPVMQLELAGSLYAIVILTDWEALTEDAEFETHHLGNTWGKKQIKIKPLWFSFQQVVDVDLNRISVVVARWDTFCAIVAAADLEL